MRIILDGGPRDGECFEDVPGNTEREAIEFVNDADYRPYRFTSGMGELTEVRFQHRDLYQQKLIEDAIAGGVPIR